MKLKKVLASGLVTALVIASLSACGNTGEQKETESKAETSSKTETKESASAEDSSETIEETYDPYGAYDETVKVAIGTMNYGEALIPETPDNGNMESNAVMNYAQEKFNIDIDYVFANAEDYNRTVTLALTTGEIPDILVVGDANMLNELIENDLVADLTEVFDTYASEELKQFYDSAFDYGWDLFAQTTFDGKLMAIPRNSVGEPDNHVFIRQDWLDAIGLKVDEDGDKIISREELELVAKTFMEEDPGNSGNPVGLAVSAWNGTVSDNNLTTVNSSFGAHHKYYFQNEDGSVYSGSTSPAMKDALAWWKDMYDKGILDPQFGTREWGGISELLVNGSLGIFFGEASMPTWDGGSLGTFETDPNALFVAYGLDDGTGNHLTAHFPVVNRFAVVRKGFEHPEILIKLLNLQYMLDFKYSELTDTNDTLDYYVENSKLDAFDLVCMADGRPDVNTYIYNEIQAYLNGELTEEEFSNPVVKQALDVVQRAEEDYASLTASEKGSYTFYWMVCGAQSTWYANDKHKFDTPILPLTTETMEARLADLDKLEVEAWVKIITGKEPLDYFDEYVEEYNALGGSAIEEELAAILNK